MTLIAHTLQELQRLSQWIMKENVILYGCLHTKIFKFSWIKNMEDVLRLKIALFPQRYPVLIILIVHNELPCVSVQHKWSIGWVFELDSLGPGSIPDVACP